IAGLSAVAPLAWNPYLAAAAEGHNEVMIARDEQTHQAAGELSLGDRITAAGYTGWTGLRENVYAYSKDPVYGRAGFFIDWGYGPGGSQSPAGHRNNILASSIAEVGIAAVAEDNPSTTVGPWLVTQDFGNR